MSSRKYTEDQFIRKKIKEDRDRHCSYVFTRNKKILQAFGFLCLEDFGSKTEHLLICSTCVEHCHKGRSHHLQKVELPEFFCACGGNLLDKKCQVYNSLAEMNPLNVFQYGEFLPMAKDSFFEVLKYLNGMDLTRLALVCKTGYQIVLKDSLWKERYFQDWRDISPKQYGPTSKIVKKIAKAARDGKISWREAYKRRGFIRYCSVCRTIYSKLDRKYCCKRESADELFLWKH